MELPVNPGNDIRNWTTFCEILHASDKNSNSVHTCDMHVRISCGDN